jgi:outer membrane protein assembly factor BamB
MKMLLGRLVTVIGIFWCVGCLPAADDDPARPRSDVVQEGIGDWPLFRGNPQQTGVATSKLPEKLEVLWKFSTAKAIEGTPAVANGVVYIGSFDEHLYAIDLKTGKEKWRYKLGETKTPAAVRDGRVYIGNLDGVLHVVDAAKGTKIWTYETPNQAEITSGVSFMGNKILFGCVDESLYCLSDKGEKLWTFRVQGGPVLATPAIAQDRTFVAGCDSTLHILDASKGVEMGSVDLGGQIGATAAVSGDQLYVGTMSSTVLGVDWKQGKVSWTYESETSKQPFYSSPAVTEKLVVLGCRDRHIRALDRAKGTEVWDFVAAGQVDCSPVIVGDRVIVGAKDRTGTLYVLDLAKGTQRAKIALDGAIIGSPAVADGRLVVATEKGTVYCLGEKKQ